MNRTIFVLILIATVFFTSCNENRAKEIKEYFSTPKTIDIVYEVDGECFEGTLDILDGKARFSPSEFEGLSFEKSDGGISCRYGDILFENVGDMSKFDCLFDVIDTLKTKTGTIKGDEYKVEDVTVTKTLPYDISFNCGNIKIK